MDALECSCPPNMQLGFAKAQHKIPPEKKCERGPGLEKLPKMQVSL